MIDINDKKDLPTQAGELKNSEIQKPSQSESVPENLAIPEKRESFKENEKIVSESLKREVEMMQIDESLKKEAEQKANKIQLLADDDKLKELLRIVKEKGVIYAIQVCKKMNDAYLLDTLHDILAKEGYYKNFVKK